MKHRQLARVRAELRDVDRWTNFLQEEADRIDSALRRKVPGKPVVPAAKAKA